jgi:hypothetical protein
MLGDDCFGERRRRNERDKRCDQEALKSWGGIASMRPYPIVTRHDFYGRPWHQALPIGLA